MPDSPYKENENKSDIPSKAANQALFRYHVQYLLYASIRVKGLHHVTSCT